MKVFDLDNKDLALTIATEVKFSTIVFSKDNQIEVVHVPVIVHQQNSLITLEGHLWKNNPLKELLYDNPTTAISCKIIFNGADGYISPNIYDEKILSGRAVPTWNYVAVHFNGQIAAASDDELINILDRQTTEFENMVGSQWRIQDAPTEYIEQIKTAIFGFKFSVENFKITAKMGQNKPTEMKNMIAWGARKDERKKDMVSWYDLISNFNKNSEKNLEDTQIL